MSSASLVNMHLTLSFTQPLAFFVHTTTPFCHNFFLGIYSIKTFFLGIYSIKTFFHVHHRHVLTRMTLTRVDNIRIYAKARNPEVTTLCKNLNRHIAPPYCHASCQLSPHNVCKHFPHNVFDQHPKEAAFTAFDHKTTS